MSSKILKNGVESLDGEDVEYYSGRFAGTFDVDTEIGAGLALDDEVAFVVTARVADPTFKRDPKTGVLSRCNKFNVEGISPLDPAKARWIYENLDRIVSSAQLVVLNATVSKAAVQDEDEDRLFTIPSVEGQMSWTDTEVGASV